MALYAGAKPILHTLYQYSLITPPIATPSDHVRHKNNEISVLIKEVKTIKLMVF
jgi:hypothetical protein